MKRSSFSPHIPQLEFWILCHVNHNYFQNWRVLIMIGHLLFRGVWSYIENSKSIQVDSASKKLLFTSKKLLFTTSGFFCRFLVWDFFLNLFFLKALKWADHEGKAEHLFFKIGTALMVLHQYISWLFAATRKNT